MDRFNQEQKWHKLNETNNQLQTSLQQLRNTSSAQIADLEVIIEILSMNSRE